VSQPVLTVIAGANGAGKSTLTAGNLDVFGAIPVLDPDVFANILHSSGRGISAISAGKEVLRSAKEHLRRAESFAVETTLSGKNYLQMMQYARGFDRCFEAVLIYIWTRSVEINLARIVKRVLVGGHDVPEIDVRRRYLRSLQNLPAAAGNADQVLLLDNSDDLGFQPVGSLGHSLRRWFSPVPVWATKLHLKFP
jgi:predicted ABC-type ATPase